jgi:hypothetical protein
MSPSKKENNQNLESDVIVIGAGGNDAGGFSGSTYNVRLAGTGCGFAFNSSRIAGENAAKYVSE